MCGIAGIMTQEKNQVGEYEPALDLMLDLMKHRGPDDRDRGRYDRLLLGHLRLSILDLSPRGRQPMVIDNGRLVISYNGEIYNYLELRRELESLGAAFSNDTDTEVILQAYNHWGMDCFRRFNGMWALALWDRDHQRLILSRDRLGIKPLYWCVDSGVLAFASEIKALAAYRRWAGRTLEISPEAVQNYLNSGQVDGAEETFFSGIYRFKAGHFMVVQAGGIRSYQPYWDLKKRALELRADMAESDSEPEGRLFEILRDAVHIHTRSDVPVGVCLSGGLDSSCVAGLASERIDGLKTFTAWYEEGGEYNELEHAEAVRDWFDLQSYPTLTGGAPLLEKLPDILWYLDEPTLAMGVYPQWHVMEAAAKEVKVVMDGQGGDEIFAGYDFYASRFLYSRLMAGQTKAYQRVLNGYYQNYGLSRVESLGREVKSLYMGNAQPHEEHLNNFLFQELTSSRLPALLRYEDRLSMAFSIESRVPLLDYRLVEFAFALDEAQKIGPGWSKYIMRRALDGYLPKDVTWRKDKKGFPTPFAVWADTVHKQTIREILHPRHCGLSKVVPGKVLENLFNAWDQGRKDPWVLWRLLSMEIWLGSYLQRLSREMSASGVNNASRPVVEAASGIAHPNPIEIIVTIDYETFDTNDFLLDSQYRIDWRENLTGPTEYLARLLEKHEARLTVLWDTVEYFWLEDNGFEEESGEIRNQLQDLVRRGHDVQLHLHPAWTSVRRDNGHWLWENPGLTAASMRAEDFEALVKRSVETMEALFKPIRSDYTVRGFRGRSYEVEPFSVIADTLMKYGLRADSSYHGYGPMPVKAPHLNKPVSLRNADFLEYPILSHNNRRWDFSGAKEAAALPLEVFNGQPPAIPPFGPALVLIGHSKQQIHYQELDRCLYELKRQYNGRLSFCRWQESIDRRLQTMQGKWLPEQGFTSDWFEQRWQEDDPFSSMQVQDPYYNRLIDLLPEKAESILDQGCAEGRLTTGIAQKTQAERVLGVDISATAVKRANDSFSQYEFQEADLLKLNLKERFDLIFSSENIIYFQPAERAVIFSNMESMLNPGGRVLLSWWSDARRGFQEDTIEQEFGRFFRIVHAETYNAPPNTAIKGAHRILMGERRLSMDEEKALKSVYWKGKRVVCLSDRHRDLKARFGWLVADWLADFPNNGAAGPIDLTITDKIQPGFVEHLKPFGTLAAYGCDSDERYLIGAGMTLISRHGPLALWGKPGADFQFRQFKDMLTRLPGPTLVFLNSPRAVDLIDRLEYNDSQIQWVTLREDTHKRCTELGFPIVTPLDVGYHFIFHKMDFRESCQYVGKGSWAQGKYQQTFLDIAGDTLMDNENIRYYNGFDLYTNGDYNAAATLGAQVLYPTELISVILKKYPADTVYSVDGVNDPMESFILKHHLKQNGGPAFFPIKLED